MKNDLSNVKVGDCIWTIKSGWEKVIILNHCNGMPYPIDTRTGCYTIDGKYRINDKHPSAFTEPPEGFNAEPKPCEFVKGQKVLVSCAPEKETFLRRYFSHMGNTGYYHCFDDGKTEWSSEGETVPWTYCIPAVKEEE